MGERYELSEGGIRLLILEISMPALPEGEAGKRIREFLASVREAAKGSAEGALSRLSEKYESDPDPKKRFRHRPYLLALSFSSEKKKRYHRIEMKVTLSKGGRVLFEKKRAARFDLQSGRLLGINRKI